jgi:hypothetical protein
MGMPVNHYYVILTYSNMVYNLYRIWAKTWESSQISCIIVVAQDDFYISSNMFPPAKLSGCCCSNDYAIGSCALCPYTFA